MNHLYEGAGCRMTRPTVHSETTGRHGRLSVFVEGATTITPSNATKNKSNNSISKFHLEDRMNRFDSAYSSGQRRVGLWLRALLLVMITTAGLLSSSSVHAQTTLTTTYSASPVCAGSSTTVTGNLTPAGVNIGYAGAGVAAAAQVAPVAANVVNLDDDQVSGQILIPGEQFVFHGETIDLGVNGFYIGSNGFVTFRNAPLETQIAPRNLGAPGLNQTYNAIYVCNTDLSPQLGGQIWWEFNAATNILYVTYEDVPFFLPGGAPGAANPDFVDVQLQLHCVGAANPGRIVIQVEDIQYNAAYINAAQNQVSIGLLNNCQAPAATIGLDQANIPNPGGYVNVCYSWDPAAPALAGSNVEFFQCPTPGVNCNGVGGSLVGSDATAPYQYVYAPPASTSNNSYWFYTRATMNNCETVTSATAQLSVTAQPTTPAAVSGNQNVCQGGSITFTATRTVTGSTFTWGTSAPGASIVTGGTGSDQATITFPSGGSILGTSYNITLQETNPAAPGCASATATLANRVTIYTVPSGSITVGTPTQCANATTTVSSSLTAPTGNTYNWSITTNPTGASLSSTTIQNPTITFPIAAVVQPTAAQTTTVQVIVANGPSNLCSATFSANLVINPVPDTNTVVSNPTATCPNQNVNYTITAGASGTISGSNTYTYSASGLAYTWQGGYINGTSTAATTRQLQWTTAAGGTGTVTVVETTPSGCTRTYSTTTTVHALPAPSIVGANTPCQFLASATGNPSFQTAPTPLNYTYGLASGNAANGYRWVVTGGNIVAANAATTTTLPATSTNTGGTAVGGNFNTGVTQVTVQWTATGAQSISCVENTVNGCQATTTMAVTVTASPVAADFAITGAGIGASTIPCAGTTPTYTVSGAGSHTISISGNSSVSAATGGLSISGSQVTGSGAGTFDVTWGSGSTGSITHEYTVGGCASVETYTISIQPLPSFTITPPTGTLCGGNSYTWNVSGLVNGGGSPTYSWAEVNDPSAIGTPGATTGSSFTVAFSNPGAAASYEVSCVVTGSAPTSCVSATVTSTVTITPTPSAPTAPAPTFSCSSDPNATRTHTYTFTGTAGGTLNWTLSGAPAGTTTAGSTTLPGSFVVTWGQIARVATAAPTSQSVTVTATQTVAGCTSASASVTTTLYAMPADAPVATTGGAPAITSLCAGTTVPIGLTVTTNGSTGQPGVNYTWSASGVTLNAPGAAPDLTRQITNLGGAGNKSITVTATDAVGGCFTVTTTSFTVAPVPTPAVGGSTNVCQETTDPVGQSHGAAWTHTYDYTTTLVSGNSYGWQITEGYIVGYSTNNGASWITPAGNVSAVGSQTLAATVDASRVRVVFYGTTPGKVKVTETFPGGAGCGTTTPDYNVNFNPRPNNQVIATTTANVCSGSNGTVTLASSQVNWTYRLQISANGGGTWTNATVATQAGTGAGLTYTVPAADLAFTATAPTASTYTFRVVATSSGASLVTGCGPYLVSGTTAINVHGIPPTPTLAVSAGSERTCFGTAINFTATGTVTWANYVLERSPVGAGTWTNVGTFGGGAGSINLADNTTPAGGIPTLASPNYDFRVRAVSTTNPPACESGNSATVSTTVFALPTNPGVTISPNPVCFEENFTVTLATTQAGVIYEVRKGGASLSPAVTVLGDGSGKTLTINSAYLMPTITSNPSTSSNVTVDVSAALVQNATHTRDIPAGGCLQSYGSTAVTVYEKPVASITSNATACGGSSTVFTPGNVTPAPNQFFDWLLTTTPPAGTTPTFANRTVNNTVNPFTVTWGDYAVSCNPVAGSPETQTQTVRLIAENANGCLDTTTRTITLYPTPYDAFIQGDATACVYGGYEEHIKTYSVKRTLGASCTFPTGTSYAWSMSTGTVSGTIRSGQGTSEIIGEWNTTGGSGTGTVTCVITLPASWGACAATKSMNVTVYPLPTPAIVGPTDVCQNNPGSPTSTSNYTSTLYTGDTYKWDVVGGTITTPGGATGAGTVASPSTITAVNGNNITVTWGSTPTNTATVTLTETTPAGCVARNTITVNVRATPTPVISGPTTMCDNAVATFSTANNAPNNTYNWTIAGNGTITAGANTASATVLSGTLAGGNFTITVTETVTATTCSKTVSQVVSLVATPVPTITRVTAGGTVGGACVNQTITYGNSDATTGTFGYLWTVSGNGAISGANNAATVAVNWTTTGTGTVTLSKWHSATQCTTTVAQNVTVVNPPAPAITGATNVCGNSTQTYSTTNNAGSTYSWTIGNATILSGSGTNALTVKWNNPAAGTTNSTTITVVETNTASGCSNSASVVVTTRYQPIAQTIAGLTQACTYDAVNNAANYGYIVANNAGSTYNWSIVGGTLQSGQGTHSVAVRWTNVGTQSISVTESDATALCSVTSTLNVAVTAQPVPVISGDLTVCATNTRTYSTPVAAGSTYNWTVSGTAADRTIVSGSNANAVTVQWLTAGTRTLTVTETAGLCSATATATVTVNATPTQTAINGLATVCNGSTQNYNVTNVGGQNYNWTVTGGTIVSGAGTSAINVQWTTVGTQTVAVTITTAGTSCSTSLTRNVAVEDQPAPAITGTSPVCTGSTTSYSTPAVAGHTYQWTLSGGGTAVSGSTSNTFDVAWTTAGTHTVTVTQRNASANCQATATMNVVVNQTPTQTAINGLATVCNGSTQNYNVTNVGGQNYTWTVTGGTIVSGAGTSAINVQWTTVGTQTVAVTITTAGTSCSTSLTRNVAVEDQPAPAITGTSPVCTGSTTSYSTPAVAGHTYQWTLSGGGTAVSGSTSNTFDVAWTTAGTHTVTVTQRNASANCQATATMNVVVNQTPTQTAINGPAVVCNGSNQNYNVTSIAGQTYNWTVTGGSITTGAGTNAISVQWTTLGNQTVGVTIGTAGTNCAVSLTRNVTVEEQPNPYVAGPTVVCTGVTAEYSTDDNFQHSYLWTLNGGGTIVSNPASSTINVAWATAGTWTLSVTQTNASGNCSRTRSATVTVQQTPTATAVTRVTPGGNLNQACQGQQITYSTPANAASSFLWTVAGGTIVGSATSNQVVVNWQTQGNGTITVTETTTGTTCATTVTQNVAVGYQPTPAIDGARVVCIDKTHTYATLTVPGSTYNWSITPANAFQTVAGYPAASEITVRWIQPGLHTMTVTETALGGFCVGVQTINVRVNPIPTPAITSATGFGNPSTRRPGVVCNNSTHNYAVTATPDNVFQWTVTGGTILSGQNTSGITVQWGAAGAGTIACTETVPGSDCITTTTQQIDIRRTPTPVITGEVNPCGNATFDYTTPLVTGNTYTWSAIGGTGVQTAPNTFRVTWTAPVWPNTTAASVTVREDVADVAPAGSCFATTTLNVTIRPIPPVPTITGPTVVCATNLNTTPATVNTASYTSSIPAITGASGSLTPTWSVTGGTIISGQGTLTANVQWNNNGSTPVTGTVSVLHTSSFGCTATGTLSVTVNPLPTPSIVGASSACQNTVENYSTVGVPGNTYVWSLTGGNVIRSGQGTPNVAVEWTLPGTATLQVAETNSFGCTVLNQRTITVNALPQAALTVSGPTTFCQGGDVTISAPLGFSNYVWNTGETARSIVVRTTGNYWCVVTDANGCSNRSDTVRVNVFPSALPIVTISGPLTFCEGGSVTLTAPAGFNGYLWSNGATTQSITVTESGSYTVSVSDGNGCTGTSTEVDVTVYAKPTPTLTVVGGPFCAGDSASISAPAGYVSYTWVSQNGVSYGTGRNIVATASDVIYCQVVDINGCTGVSDTVNLVFTRVETPVVTVNGPTTFCEGGAVTLTAPAGYSSYIWSNGTVGRTITVDRAGEYYVTVATQTCPAVSAKTAITVNNLPAVPTIQRMGDVLTANSTAATAYQWIRNGADMPGASNKQLTVNLPGAYRVRITDANGCENTSEAFDVILTDVNDDVVAGHQAALRVSPNPTSGRFTIETVVSEAGPVRIELVNALGELVMTLNEASVAGNFRATVDMGTLSAGAYNVVVTAGNQRWVARMVRQ